MRYFDDLDDAVVLAVKTTGPSRETDRIVAASMLRGWFSTLRDNPGDLKGATLNALFNPQREIPAEATRVHGITNASVAKKNTFAESARLLRDFIGPRAIVAHNATFNTAFLSAEFARAGVQALEQNKQYCTMQRYQEMSEGRRAGNDLNEVARQFGIPGQLGPGHLASEDVRITCAIAREFYLLDSDSLSIASREQEWQQPAAVRVVRKPPSLLKTFWNFVTGRSV